MSLAAVGNWIRGLGRLEPSVAFGQGIPFPPRAIPEHYEIAKASACLKQAVGDKDMDSQQKSMTALRHSAELSTTVQEGEAPMRLDTNVARWKPVPS